MYKAGMAITENFLSTPFLDDLVYHIFYYCDIVPIRTSCIICRVMFATRTEGDILNAIRNLAGKDEGTLVQRFKLNRKTPQSVGIRPFFGQSANSGISI
jgi:hypothetical protein